MSHQILNISKKCLGWGGQPLGTEYTALHRWTDVYDLYKALLSVSLSVA